MYKFITALLLVSLAFTLAPVSAETENNEAAERAAWRAAWNELGIKDYERPVIRIVEAQGVKEFPAIEARQGAAADADHFYAVVNYVIGKYDRKTGALIGRWKGERGGLIGHLNSCFVEGGRLLCANSNHPKLPMASSIETFDTKTMTHVESKSLGVMDEGSLVWFDHYKDGWVAGFAHYDDETGLPFKNHTYASVVTFDKGWRRTGGYALPASLLEKMAPQAASGGAIGNDGRLYVMGHDLPEMYVLEFPTMGPVLTHVATIAVPAEGQAFAFDLNEPRRAWAISRPRGLVLSFDLPEIK